MSVPAATTSARVSQFTARRPTNYLLVHLVLALVAAAVLPSLIALEDIWRDTVDYRHGYLIAGAVFYVLFEWRHRIDAVARETSLPGALTLLFFLFIWLVTYRANSELLQQILIPIVWLSAVWGALGARVALVVAPAIAFLYFAIPIWEAGVPALQAATTFVSEHLLALIGVPTNVIGSEVSIPAGNFTVAEGCSGKRYLVVALATAALHCLLNTVAVTRLVLLAVVATGLALLTNWIRVTLIIYLGHITQMQHYFVAVEHQSLGWALFVPLIVGVLVTARALTSEYSAPPTEQHVLAPAVRTAAQLRVPTILLAFTAFMIAVPSRPDVDQVDRSLAAFPLLTGEVQGPLPTDHRWQPYFTSADQEQRARYHIEGSALDVYLNLYAWQAPGREVVYFANRLVPADWVKVGLTAQRLPYSARITELFRDSNGKSWLVSRIYNVGGVVTQRSFLAQLAYGVQSLLHPVRAGVVIVASPCDQDCSEASAAMDRFWSQRGETMASLIHPLR